MTAKHLKDNISCNLFLDANTYHHYIHTESIRFQLQA